MNKSKNGDRSLHPTSRVKLRPVLRSLGCRRPFISCSDEHNHGSVWVSILSLYPSLHPQIHPSIRSSDSLATKLTYIRKYQIHGRLIEVRQYPPISGREESRPGGFGPSSGPRCILLQPKPHRYILPPAQACKILSDWERIEPIEIPISPISIDSGDESWIPTINVNEEEEEEYTPYTVDIQSTDELRAEEEVRSEEEEKKQKPASGLGTIRAKMLEMRERWLRAGLGLKKRWKALLYQ